MKKVAIITGASSGIGYETANYFTQMGYVVYGTGRTIFETDKFNYEVIDVNNSVLMKELFEKVYKKYGRIDVLVNNAGMGISGAVENLDKEKVEKIFNVNAISVVDCCKNVLPYLRQSKGTIINLSSVGAPIAIPFQACYTATKCAVEGFSLALRNEVRQFGVKVCMVRPGDTKTGFTKSREKTDLSNEHEYAKIVNKSVGKMEKDEQNGMSPNCVAKLIYKLSKKKNPAPIYTVGFAYKCVSVLAKTLPTRFLNYLIYKIYG